MLPKEITKCAEKPEPRNLAGFSLKDPGARASTARRIYSSTAVKTATGIGAVALAAAVYYRIRELLAALLLFSFLFGVVMIAVLILWLVEQTAHEAAVHIETHMGHMPVRRTAAPSRRHAGHILWRIPWN